MRRDVGGLTFVNYKIRGTTFGCNKPLAGPTGTGQYGMRRVKLSGMPSHSSLIQVFYAAQIGVSGFVPNEKAWHAARTILIT